MKKDKVPEQAKLFEFLRYHTSALGDEQFSLKDYICRI